MTVTVDNSEHGYVEYKTTFLEPQNLSVLNNKIALKIIEELSSQSLCAMDIARKMDQHEQKIYYHLNKLQKAGIVKLVGTEKRYGMVAQLYELVSPVIATKLHDKGKVISSENQRDEEMVKILKPFIDDGKLNSTIIFGDPYPHGRFNTPGLDSCYVSDVSMLLGSYLKNTDKKSYKIDVQITDKDLFDNIILIGSPKTNTIVDKLNEKMPIFFDEKNSFSLVSTISDKVYDDDMLGVVIRMENPFAHGKEIIILGGRRTRGTMAAVSAFTKHLKEIMKGNNNNNKIMARIVRGVDKDGDGFVDDCEFIE